MDSRAPSPFDTSLGATLGRAMDLAQQVAADELQLLQIETHERVGGALRRSVWIGAAAFCLAIAWIAAWTAALVALEGRYSLEARLTMLAVSQFGLGAFLLALGLRGRSGPR